MSRFKVKEMPSLWEKAEPVNKKMSKLAIFKKTSNLVIAVISSITLFYVISYLSSSKDFNPVWIYSGNFYRVIEYFSSDQGLINVFMNVKNKGGGGYPPMYFINLLFPLYLFGRNWFIMVATVNTFYLIMIMIFTYLLGKELKDNKTGLIATILISMYPATWVSYRTTSMEFALMGVTAMSVYFLYRSECFKNLIWTLMFALSCAWGMWIKNVFLGFIIGPLLYVFCKALINSRKNRSFQPVLNFLAFAITFYAAIYPYYFVGLLKLHTTDNIRTLMGTTLGPDMGVPNFKWHSFENIRPFLYDIWEEHLGFTFFIVFLAGIYYFFRSIKFSNKGDPAGIDLKVMLVLWIIIPNLMVFMIPTPGIYKIARYLMPQGASLALISAFLLRRVIDRKIGLLFFVMLIGLGVFHNYRIIRDESKALQHIGYMIPMRNSMPDYSSMAGMKTDIIEEIKKITARNPDKNNIIISTVNNYFYDYRTFLWFNGIDVDEIEDVAEIDCRGDPAVWFKIFFKKLDSSDLLIKVNDKNPMVRYDFEYVKNLLSNFGGTVDLEKYRPDFDKKLSMFELSKVYYIPTGIKLEMYIKNNNEHK